ncbi:MAG TPA: phosphatase PAP2 family protein, partial [Jiangellaceae bacterium]
MATGARVEAPRAPEHGGSTAGDQRKRWLIAAREALFIVVATQLYSRVRGIADNQIHVAYDNAERIIALERALNIFGERSVQRAVIGNEAIIHIANTVYIWGFAPLMVGTLAWLIVRRPAHYALFRNALLASGAVALVLFATFPLAPPRFMPQYGFVDTVELHASWYRTFNGSAVVNEYAAMPSLHFGWVLLAGIAIGMLSKYRAVRIGAVAAPLLMFA